MKHKIVFLAVFVITVTGLFAQKAVYEKKIFVYGNDSLPYRILYPENYDKDAKYPFLLFLHGSGERGNDNEKQLVHGSSLFANAENRKLFPSIVVFPQCPEGGYWSPIKLSENGFSFVNSKTPTEPMQLVIRLIKQLEKNEAVDRKRLYVAGLSMGGMGTLDLICRKPKMFAAAVSICGAIDTERLKKVTKMPVRLIHGDADNAVSPDFSIKAYDKLKADGSERAELIIFSGVGHNSWDPAFKKEDFLKWIYSQSL